MLTHAPSACLASVLTAVVDLYLQALKDMTGTALSGDRSEIAQSQRFQVPDGLTAMLEFSGELEGSISVNCDPHALATALGVTGDTLGTAELGDILMEALNCVSSDAIQALTSTPHNVGAVPPHLVLGRLERPAGLYATQRVQCQGFKLVFCISASPVQQRLAVLTQQLREYDARMSRAVTHAHEAQTAAEGSNRAKSEFLAMMSHEIRTPMNGILGCAELVRSTRLDEHQDELITTIWQSANALLRLIDDILDFSKIEAGKLTLEEAPIELGTIVKQVVALAEIRANKNNTILVARLPAEPIPTVLGDSVRIRQILLNLLSNAIKFTPDGRVELTMRCTVSDDNLALMHFTVADTGIGIPKNRLAHIFDKFQQAEASTTRNFGGTGLGLAICKQVVGLMGGDIKVTSKVGRGSTFQFSFGMPCTALAPASAAAPVQLQQSAHAAAQPLSQVPRGLKVLLAEDNAVNRLVATNMLRKLGVESVTIAVDGREAVDHGLRERWDLIFMDIQMPEKDGYQAAREIRALSPAGVHPPILALTANAAMDERERCLASGMDDYLSKPYTMQQLREALCSWGQPAKAATG